MNRQLMEAQDMVNALNKTIDASIGGVQSQEATFHDSADIVGRA